MIKIGNALKNEINKESLERDLSYAGLYESVYKPAFNRAEKALMDGKPSDKFNGNEWDYAIDAVNKSNKLKGLSKKYGKKISIVDTGPSENNWKYKIE